MRNKCDITQGPLGLQCHSKVVHKQPGQSGAQAEQGDVKHGAAAVQRSRGQRSAAECRAVQQSAGQCSRGQCSAAEDSAAEGSAVQQRSGQCRRGQHLFSLKGHTGHEPPSLTEVAELERPLDCVPIGHLHRLEL